MRFRVFIVPTATVSSTNSPSESWLRASLYTSSSTRVCDTNVTASVQANAALGLDGHPPKGV